MTILPLKLISDSDKRLFGEDISNLARLARANFPVPDAICISPPQIVLNTILEHFNYAKQEIFEQSLVLVKNRLLKIPLPVELEKALGKKKHFFFDTQNVTGQKNLWQRLLTSWLDEIRSQILRLGFSDNLLSQLNSQVVFITKENKGCVVQAFWEKELKEVLVETKGVKIHPQKLNSIDLLVIEANKRLFIPQVYQFWVTDRVRVVSVKPYTEPVAATVSKRQIELPKQEIKAIVKSAMKVFLNLSEGLTIVKEADGVLIEGDLDFDYERLAFKLIESSLSFPHNSVIFKLPGDSFSLIHHSSLLNQVCELFLFARNKKGLFNIQLAIPKVISPYDLIELKKELAVRGIHRKGFLKFWLDLSVPENFINLDQYLSIGFDGALISFDSLSNYLKGIDPTDEILKSYHKSDTTVTRFTHEGLKKLSRLKIPVLVQGQLLLRPEVLEFLIEEGVWGVVANNLVEAETLPEELKFNEHRVVLKKAAPALL